MRILHTSDWHIGANTNGVSRHEEHERFFKWLLGIIEEHSVDILVVAGDIFQTNNPSSQAQKSYYNFLRQAADTGLTKIVVVGGNHDSARRLDAPGELLQCFDIAVIGDKKKDLKEMIVPLRRRGSKEDQIDALCVAMPFVSEFHLKISTTDCAESEIRAIFEERFSKLYTELADLGQQLYPGVPMISTGHLTVGYGRSTAEDYPQQIHRVGTIDALGASIFDSRFSYNALGHIHRCMKINQSTWYSGSPIAFSLTGMKAAKQILLVDLDIATPETVSVQKIEVPQHRRILKLEGTLSEIKKHIADLKCTLSFPPLLHVVIDRANSINFHRSDLNSNLSEALKLHPENLRPILSTVEVLDSKSTEEHSSTIQPSKTDPLPVFEHLCLVEGKTGEERSQLLHAFNTIAQHSNADFNDFVAQIQDPNHETS